MGRSNHNASIIVEGLADSRISESANEFESVAVCRYNDRLQKLISQSLTAKYNKIFSRFGDFGIEIDIFTRDDRDIMLDDVIYDIGFSIVFVKTLSDSDVKDIKSLIKKNMRNYPEFEYEKSDNSFWFEVESNEDIIDLLDTIGKERVNMNRLYKVVDGDDISDYLSGKEKEFQAERDYDMSLYNRMRM